MIAAYYQGMFYISILLTMIYLIIWHKHLDIHITLTFVLVPMVNLSFALISQAQTFEGAMFANKLTYVGCFLLLNIMLGVFSLCGINLPRFIKALFFAFSSAVFIAAFRAKSGGLFYKAITYRRVNGIIMLEKEYGILHHVFYAMIIIYFLCSLWALIYSYRHKNQVSKNIIGMLFVPEVVSLICFFWGKPILNGVELVPAAYNISLLMFLLIVYRISVYNIVDSAIESMVQSGDTGFASFDFDLNYLGSNETAKKMLPMLAKLPVDGLLHQMMYRPPPIPVNQCVCVFKLPRLKCRVVRQPQPELCVAVRDRDPCIFRFCLADRIRFLRVHPEIPERVVAVAVRCDERHTVACFVFVAHPASPLPA